MGRIISLLQDPHRDVQALLPWYAMGRLDPAEHAEVTAHLEGCAECREELAFDRQFNRAIGDTPLDVEQSWAAMRRRIQGAAPKRSVGARLREWLGRGRAGSREWSPAFGWALAAQAGLLLCAGALLTQYAAPDRYHALGAAAANPAGNLVVIFRPEVTERTIRTLLKANAARMVDGPTATDAYVLYVPAASRAAVLQKLRKTGDVVLAEPIDASAKR